MKGLRKKLTFTALCLAVGLAVFSVSYTLMGQGPGGDTDSGGAVGGVDDGEKGKKPTPEVPEEMLPGDEEPGPVGQVNELFDVIVGGDVPALKQLLEDGADPNARSDSVTPLGWAILGSGRTPTVYTQVEVLLAAGADPNLIDDRGQTALHYAAQYGGSDAVTQALIDGGVSVNTQDSHGATALQLALFAGNDGATSMLEQAGAVRPEQYEQLKAIGTFGKKLRAAATKEDKKTVLESESSSMVKRGWMTEAERQAILKAIEDMDEPTSD